MSLKLLSCLQQTILRKHLHTTATYFITNTDPTPHSHTHHSIYLALGPLLQPFLQCLQLRLQSAHLILSTMPLTSQLHLHTHEPLLCVEDTDVLLGQEAYLELRVCPL